MTPALLLLGPALASDILVPAFTPRAVDDLDEAARLTEVVVQAGRNAGLDLADPELVEARAGVAALACADDLRCPADLWPRFREARLTVVGQVGAASEGTSVLLRFYAWDRSRPVEELSLVLSPGAESGFAERVAERAAALLQDIPTPPVEPVVPAQPAPARVVIIGPEEAAPEDPGPELHLPPWDQEKFEASGLDAEAFRRRAHVRTGRASLELWAGGAFGDLDRYYDVRLALEEVDGDRVQSGVYQYSTFRNRAAATVGLTVAYAPISWAEAALSVGVQLTRQEQVVGYELDGEVVRTAFTPGRTMLGVVEPAFRVLPIAAGPLKPYVLAGLNLRFFPGYAATESGGLTYPALPGGVSLGPTVGLGLAVDTGHATGFLEVPWTLLLLPSESISGAANLTRPPDEPAGVGQVLLFKAGVGLRL